LDRPLPLAQRIYEEIRRDMFRGTVPAGRLVELELAKRYGVSRTPVRQALQRLTAAGFTETVPSGGYILKRTSSREVREILDLRSLLEPEGARLAAGEADPSQNEGLMVLAARSENAFSAGTPDMSELSYEFHSAIADTSTNRPLARIVRRLNERLMAHEAFGPHGALSASSLGREHLDIATAIAAHDGDAAALAMRQHLANSHRVIVGWLRESETGS
jgi:DNA-binding GntR family transcriptional regulator